MAELFEINALYEDRDAIKAIAEMMNETGLTSIKLKLGDHEIELERGGTAPVAMPMPAMASVAAAPDEANASAPEIKGGTPVKTPMVGVFYAAPSPEDEPFVKVGDSVKKGDVLCIVEAMKLMNEITAEQDGVIAEICAEDGSLVEYGQTLFILK